jgi:hypothetical protein
MTRHNQDQAAQAPTSAASDHLRAQISTSAMASHLATVARLSQRLEQARYEARSLIAKAG